MNKIESGGNAKKEQILEVLYWLMETYPGAYTEARLKVYASMLDELPIEQIRAAAGYHVKHCKFFPTVSEFFAYANGITDDRAGVQWLEVRSKIGQIGMYGYPRFDDPTTKYIVDRYGWRSICMKTEKELQFFEKDFRQKYAAMSSPANMTLLEDMSADVRKLLPGIGKHIAQIAGEKR